VRDGFGDGGLHVSSPALDEVQGRVYPAPGASGKVKGLTPFMGAITVTMDGREH
jgi:hypothetical protein